MKIHVDRQVFANAVQVVAAAVPTRSTKPILNNLKLIASPQGSQLLATDLEIGVRFALEGVEILQPGEALIPAKELSEILRESRDERVHIELKQGHVVVTTDRSEFRILHDVSDEFPEIPEFDAKGAFSLPTAALLDLVNKTSFAVATEPTRYAINGVLMNLDGKSLKMVGTDGKRLSFARAKIDGGESKLNVIVSTKGLQFLPRILGESDAEIRVRAENNQLMFQTSKATLVSLLIEGHFPRYEDVIPGDLTLKIDMDRAAFETNLRKARLMTSDESKAVRLHFQDNCLTLSSRAPEKGESRIDMEVVYDGAALDIGFDPRYLLDGLKVIRESTVRFELKDANSPGTLREGKDYVYVVMPISLS